MIRSWTPEDDIKPSQPGYKVVKAWFQQCRTLASQINAQKQKIQRIRDLSEKCTQNLSGMPMGGGNGDKIGCAVERMDAEEQHLRRLEERSESLRVEAIRRAYCLTSTRQAEFICKFYVDGKSLKTIADEAGIHNDSTIYASIRSGCDYLAEMFSDWNIDEYSQKSS